MLLTSTDFLENIQNETCMQGMKHTWVLTNFPYKLLWTNMDTLWTVVITQPRSIVVGKHFTVTIIRLLNVISRIPIINLLLIYVCTNSSWNIRAAICFLRTFVVVGIVECLQPDRGGWELIDSHGAGAVSCPFTTGRGVGTKTCGMDNGFLLATFDLAWTLPIVCTSGYI